MSVSRSNQAICLCNLFFLSFIIFFPHFSHPLSFSINQFNATTKGVVYQGDAWPSSEVIELNKITYKFRVGRAMYAEPLHLWDSTTGSLADFSTHFAFMVDTGNSEIFSDGVAFFLSPVGYQFLPFFSVGGLGLFNTHASTLNASQSQVVSMEFDTWSDNEWDPPGPHLGINIKDISSVVYADWNVSIISGKLGNAWITYNATANNLTMFWTFTEKFNPAFLGNASSIIYHVDLRKVLPEWVTIDFSASSGEFSERHVISSWEFNSTLVDNDIRRGKIKQKKKKTFLILVIAIPGFTLMLGVIVCWLVVSRKRRNNNS